MQFVNILTKKFLNVTHKKSQRPRENMDPSSTYVCALTLSKKPCQNNSEILVGYIYIIGLQLKKTLSGPNSEEL